MISDPIARPDGAEVTAPERRVELDALARCSASARACCTMPGRRQQRRQRADAVPDAELAAEHGQHAEATAATTATIASATRAAARPSAYGAGRPEPRGARLEPRAAAPATARARARSRRSTPRSTARRTRPAARRARSARPRAASSALPSRRSRGRPTPSASGAEPIRRAARQPRLARGRSQQLGLRGAGEDDRRVARRTAASRASIASPSSPCHSAGVWPTRSATTQTRAAGRRGVRSSVPSRRV